MNIWNTLHTLIAKGDMGLECVLSVPTEEIEAADGVGDDGFRS